jgi:pantetheine-phosphate adenylyltransferase
MKIAVFPGSFDPITKGHESLVRRALPLFDKVIVGLGVNSSKKYFFEEEKRLEFLKATFQDEPRVEIEKFEILTVDFCREKGADFLLRGLRNVSDFDYESTIALLNKDIGEGLETVFLIADPGYNYYSSTIVREILKGGKDVSKFLPAPVMEILKKK